MRYVTLESMIPAADPEKARIEGQIMRAFEEIAGGPWRITITQLGMTQDSGQAWSISIAGGHSFTVGSIRSAADIDDFVALSMHSRASRTSAPRFEKARAYVATLPTEQKSTTLKAPAARKRG